MANGGVYDAAGLARMNSATRYEYVDGRSGEIKITAYKIENKGTIEAKGKYAISGVVIMNQTCYYLLLIDLIQFLHFLCLCMTISV